MMASSFNILVRKALQNQSGDPLLDLPSNLITKRLLAIQLQAGSLMLGQALGAAVRIHLNAELPELVQLIASTKALGLNALALLCRLDGMRALKLLLRAKLGGMLAGTGFPLGTVVIRSLRLLYLLILLQAEKRIVDA
jgi:hypothetical protein